MSSAKVRRRYPPYIRRPSSPPPSVATVCHHRHPFLRRPPVREEFIVVLPVKVKPCRFVNLDPTGPNYPYRPAPTSSSAWSESERFAGPNHFGTAWSLPARLPVGTIPYHLVRAAPTHRVRTVQDRQVYPSLPLLVRPSPINQVSWTRSTIHEWGPASTFVSPSLAYSGDKVIL